MPLPLSDHHLAFHEVTCSRGDRVVFAGLSFGLTNGGLLHVRGPNGSGKTSLLRMICGLLPPSGGAIAWNGCEIRSLGEDFHANFAYVGHLNAIQEQLEVHEQLHISARLAGLTTTSVEIAIALASFGLQDAVGMPCKFLSQGQKRRLALARLALGAARPLWVLDEPFATLDAAGIENVRRMIEEHLAGGGLAIITTHQDVSISAKESRHVELGQ